MSKPTISAVVSVYNREDRISQVLDSLTWVDELIVVDNGSTDRSLAIAKNYTKHVFTFTNNLMLNVNKNKGIAKATCDWILYLDDDEEITVSLAKEIRQVINNSEEVQGYWIARKNIIFGKWIQYGLWWPDKQLRLFRNGAGKYPENHVHEYIAVDGKTSTLRECYTHYNYDTVNQFLKKLSTLYTENEVEVLQKSGYQLVWSDAIRFPVSDFIKIYFAQSGYKDGLHGLVLAIFQAIYSFVIFSKLWEKQGFPTKEVQYPAVDSEIGKVGKEFSFWRYTTFINLSHSPIKKTLLKLLKKLTQL